MQMLSNKQDHMLSGLLGEINNDLENCITDIRSYGSQGDQHVAGRLEDHQASIRFLLRMLGSEVRRTEFMERYDAWRYAEYRRHRPEPGPPEIPPHLPPDQERRLRQDNLDQLEAEGRCPKCGAPRCAP